MAALSLARFRVFFAVGSVVPMLSASGCGGHDSIALNQEEAILDAGPRTRDANDAPDVAPLAPEPPAEPTPPEPPEPPRADCPEGWILEEGPPAVCRAYPRHFDPSSCTGSTVAYPGETGCHPLGAPCPQAPERFPSPPSGTHPLYVDGSALTGGDGSEAAPFDSVDAALAAASTGDALLLGAGTYAVPDALPDGLALVGACASEVTLLGSITAGDLSLRNVRVRGTVSTRDGAMVELSGVHLEDAQFVALLATGGGSIVASDVLVTGLTRSGVPSNPRAVEASEGGFLVAHRLALRGNEGVGVFNLSSTVDVKDLLVADHKPPDLGGFVQAVFVQGGRTAISRAHLQGGTPSVVLAHQEDTTLGLTDTVITGAHASSERLATGVAVGEGAHLTMKRALIENNRQHGVLAVSGSDVHLTDAVIRGVMEAGHSNDNANGAVLVAFGASVTADRLWIDSVNGLGLGALMDATLHVTDVTVKDVTQVPNEAIRERLGYGLFATLADVHVARLSIERARGFGAQLDSSNVDLVDLGIDGVLPGTTPSGVISAGLGIQARGTDPSTGSVRPTVALVERARIRDTGHVGATLLTPDTEVRLIDVDVDHIATSEQRRSRGMEVASIGQAGLTVDAERLRIRGFGTSGLVVGQFAAMAVRDLIVERGRVLDIAPPNPLDGVISLGFGRAVTVIQGELDIDRARIDDVAEGGLIAHTARLTGESIDIRNLRSIEAGDAVGNLGRGIDLVAGTEATLSRVRIETARDLGLSGFDDSTTASVSDLVVTDARGRDCPADVQWCQERPFGVGVGSYGASVTVQDFLVSHTRLAGVQLARDGLVVLRNGVVSHNPIGFSALSDFDPHRSIEQVVFVHNLRNLDATSLPLPDPSAALSP